MKRLILAIALALTSTAALAQTRYDHDGRWIYETIKEERAEARQRERREARREARQRERREARREARFYREGDRHHGARRYYWVEHTRRYSDHYRPRDIERGYVEHRDERTRVYGMTIRGMAQIDTRDCRNGCCPPVENISRAHSSENNAWNDAQLGWMKAVSVRYGAMYADVQNVDSRSLIRQCFRCEFNEDWISRNREALAQNTGTGNGFKTCCRIIARACIQPIQGASETPLKGDYR